MKSKKEYYDRMAQRLDLLDNKVNGEKPYYDFMQNMVDEHLKYYIDLWFTKEEAYILIHFASDRIKEWLTERGILDLLNIFTSWDIEDFFYKISDLIDQNSQKFKKFEDIYELLVQLKWVLLKYIEENRNKDKVSNKIISILWMDIFWIWKRIDFLLHQKYHQQNKILNMLMKLMQKINSESSEKYSDKELKEIVKEILK